MPKSVFIVHNHQNIFSSDIGYKIKAICVLHQRNYALFDSLSALNVKLTWQANSLGGLEENS